MKFFPTSVRIVFGLVGLTISAVLMAGLLGLIPNAPAAALKSRKSFCESAAVSFMALASRSSMDEIRRTFDAIRERNPEVRSLAIRQQDGSLLFESADHTAAWQSTGQQPVTDLEFIVPIYSRQDRWGQLEVRFLPVKAGALGWLLRPEFSLSLFIGTVLYAAFTLYLRRVLRQLNPARVVPPRVREALNALAEGLLLLDREGRVVLVNEALTQQTGLDAQKLTGHPAGDLQFHSADPAVGGQPWTTVLQTGVARRGLLMKRPAGGVEHTFSVSIVPIHDETQECHGVVVSFEDVTELDRKQRELRDALVSLKHSSEEVRQRNQELEFLATRDVLTGCFNRRSFFRMFESTWNHAVSSATPLTVLMVDIDHFKSINDSRGHSAGDEVLRKVAAVVMSTVSEVDMVCRYGGEEFAVLMPGTDLDEAELRAERIRLAIRALKPAEISVTASLGVSDVSQMPGSPQELLDQADKCLYVAKRSGRNRVVRFDRAKLQIAQLGDLPKTSRQQRREPAVNLIPFQAVSALQSAMSFRDQPTAAHCRRVADLCVATAEGLLSMRECYTLEIAALLHDIGKISVPDVILQNSGQLTELERSVMNRARQAGVQMIKASFGSDALADIVAQLGDWFDQSRGVNGTPVPARPGISARILAIADAYDSMTSSTTYRRRRTRTEAFEELRRFAGSQFDPELVERFIAAVRLRSGDRAELPGVSTDIALDIGRQIELLVTALDEQNLEDLRDLTERLHMTAREAGIDNMADITAQLTAALQHDKDMIGIMQVANELLDLCRLTQVSLIQGDRRQLASV
jgi:diguanylate cyclase (GGDEF)-like protein/PAS domain S-box-containing protein